MYKNVKKTLKSKVFLVYFLKRCYNTDRFVKGGINVSKVVVRNGNVDSALRTMKQKTGVRRREKKEQGIKNTRKRERYNH